MVGPYHVQKRQAERRGIERFRSEAAHADTGRTGGNCEIIPCPLHITLTYAAANRAECSRNSADNPTGTGESLHAGPCIAVHTWSVSVSSAVSVESGGRF